MNTVPIGVLVILLVGLILLSGFFSGSETALMSLNRYRLRHQAKQGHRGAIRTAKLLERPDRLISLILLGNNFVNILASAIATVIALRLMGEAGIAVATGLLTLVILVFAEVTPKTLATLRTEQIAYLASAVYQPLMKAVYPLVLATNWMSGQILKLFKVDKESTEVEALSSDELRTVLNETTGMIPPRNRDMLVNILDLSTVSVNDIMVPRNEITGLDIEDSWDEVKQQISESRHSRMLVFKENIDEVQGFIYLRKMFDSLHTGDYTRETLEKNIREPYFIPEGTTLTVQLLNFQREKRRIGLVVDEYGDIQGLITIEDIVEEIVGEFDTDPYHGPEEVQAQGDGSFIAEGSAQIRALNKALEWDLSADGPKTLNGIVLEHFENFPPQGAVFTFNGHSMTVLEVEENFVRRVRIDPKVETIDDEAESS